MMQHLMMIARVIQKCYKTYNVDICLVPHSCRSGSIIFVVQIQGGTTIGNLMLRAEEVKAILHIPYFIIVQQEQTFFLLIADKNTRTIDLTEMMAPEYLDQVSPQMKLPIAVGCSIFREMDYEDLAKFQHTAYTGSTGSGKSVGLQCLIMSLASFRSAAEVNLLIIDAGGRSLWCFDGLPHLSYPIVKDIENGMYVLSHLVAEMERRLKLSNEELEALPTIVCVFDEFVSFLDNQDKKEMKACKDLLNNILRRARKFRIYLVLATQSPKQEYLDGIDLNNITTRVAFRNMSKANSTSALGCVGAENLIGKGDMLIETTDYPASLRLQGAYINEAQIKELVAQLANEQCDLTNKFTIPEMEKTYADSGIIVRRSANTDINDPKAAKFLLWTLAQTEVSVNKSQQELGLSRNDSEKYIAMMCEQKFISEKNSNQPRKVIPQSMADFTEEQMKFLAKYGCTEKELAKLYQ